MLLFGGSNSDKFDELAKWSAKANVHKFLPDFHRLQLERWIWDHRLALVGRILDIGVEIPRRWIGEGYKTFGFSGCDISGDLLAMPFKDESFDSIILTEVLEHCTNPFTAIAEVWRVLKPAGLLLVTAPFVWPWHGTIEYDDYWRFTAQAWRLLLKDFASVKIVACQWTPEGEQHYDFMRRFECMGMRDETHATTGYLCEALK
jgi:SAM-dependent methyltransferase